MTHKNMHDRQRECRILRSQERFNTMTHIGDVRRAGRQLMRSWAVSGRTAFGSKSIEAYCDYAKRHMDFLSC